MLEYRELTSKDLDVLEYQAVAFLESTYMGQRDFGNIREKENRQGLIDAPPSDFDDPEEAEEVQNAVRHLRSSFGWKHV